VNESEQILQAYRLYALAPDNVEEMNRLLQVGNLTPQAYWMLAAALAKAGRADEAAKAMDRVARQAAPIRNAYEIFHSTERDQSIILFGLKALNAPTEQTLPLARQLAGRITQSYYYNTQELVWALLALEPFLSGGTGERGVNVTARLGAATEALVSQSGPAMAEMGRRGGKAEVRNLGKASCYITLTHQYEPIPGTQAAQSDGISLEVAYTDNSGETVNLAALKQGQNLLAKVTVTGKLPGIYLGNLALTWFAPAGFEIRNDRLTAPDDPAPAGVEHQDIRDDKVRWFFAIDGTVTKTFSVPVTAAYPGSYTLPPATVEDMYHPERRASAAAGKVVITRAAGL
jgi:uncharacterized protein YfaS (alpha-2-macroglobulin family)